MWYFEYVEMRDQPPNEPRETGIIVHDYAELVLLGETPVSVPVHGPEVTALFDVFIRDIAPTYDEPVLIEAAFELDVEGVTYTGFIDAVDRRLFETTADIFADEDPPKVIVRDLKTTKNRPRPGKYRNALIGYGLGARELGFPPDLFRLDYIVRTKQPYYWPEDQEVPDQDEIDIWASNVVRVHRSIEEGDWEATGVGTYVCSYCPFTDICGPYDRWKELTSPLREEE